METQTPKSFIDITRFCIAIACLLAKFIVLAMNATAKYQQSYGRTSNLLEELYDTAASEQLVLAVSSYRKNGFP